MLENAACFTLDVTCGHCSHSFASACCMTSACYMKFSTACSVLQGNQDFRQVLCSGSVSVKEHRLRCHLPDWS